MLLIGTNGNRLIAWASLIFFFLKERKKQIKSSLLIIVRDYLLTGDGLVGARASLIGTVITGCRVLFMLLTPAEGLRGTQVAAGKL